MLTVTYKEAEKAYHLAQESFFMAADKASRDKKYGLRGASDNYKELFAYYIVLRDWKQNKFSSEGYNNINTKDKLLAIVARINKLR